MHITVRQTTSLPNRGVIALALFREQRITDHPWFRGLPSEAKKSLKTWAANRQHRLDFLSTKVFHFSDPGPTVVLLGLGERKLWTVRRDRLLTRRYVRLAHEHAWSDLTVAVQRLTVKAAEQMTENFLLADYEFTAYRQAPPHGWPHVRRVTILTKNKDRSTDQAVHQGLIIGQAINAGRNLANTPGGVMTPKLLAAAAKKLGKLPKVRVKVLGRTQMKKLKMGGIIGVAAGSEQEPQFIVLEYAGTIKKQAPLVFVGKGVTFDSGGLNVKPGDSMNEMHMDMSGGAAVIAAMEAIAKLKLPVHVVGLVPAVENMPSGSGYRPGDLLRSMSGKTIEVGNTDAEGRIILADGLTYAQKVYRPALVVDLATLTGAAMVALGQQATALFTRDESLMAAAEQIGERSGDYVWPLPLWEEYESDIKGTFGDISNAGKSRYGGAINGAMFLYQFVKGKPWIHLDIAPTMTAVDGQWLAKGSSGVGVRWLVALARHWRDGRIVIEHP